MRSLGDGLSWSPDGSQVGQGYEDGTVVIWDAESWEEVMSLETGTKFANTVEWSPTGDRILTTNWDSTTLVWDATSGELLLDFDSHEGQVFSGEWSPDGSRIATTEPGAGKIIIWDPENGEEILQIDLLEAVVAVWSPDGERIATTSWSGHGSIRDAASGEVQFSLFPEDSHKIVEGSAWSHDGKKLVMFSEGHGWIFDTTTGEQLVELSSGFTSSVWNILWSLGDERVFAFGGDGTYRVFEAVTGIELLVYDFGGWPNGALSPDDTLMLIGTNDGKISLYPTWLTTEELIAYAKECCVVRELTPEEREVFGLPER
jgi:WD40 repeat protein